MGAAVLGTGPGRSLGLRPVTGRSVALWVALAVPLLAALWVLLLARHAASTAPQPAGQGFQANFAGLSLQDQDGRPADVAAWRDTALLVNFVYTTCSSACPLQTRALAEVQAALPPSARQGLRLVSVSLDPLNDTPATLKAYARRMGADTSNWSFLTGNPRDIGLLSERLRLFPADGTGRRPDDHATSLWLAAADGRLLMRYAGTPPDVARLVRELGDLTAVARATP